MVFQNPPNFLVQSDIENYETRKVTVYNSGDAPDGNLIDVDNNDDAKTIESRSSSPDLHLLQYVY